MHFDATRPNPTLVLSQYLGTAPDADGHDRQIGPLREMERPPLEGQHRLAIPSGPLGKHHQGGLPGLNLVGGVLNCLNRLPPGTAVDEHVATKLHGPPKKRDAPELPLCDKPWVHGKRLKKSQNVDEALVICKHQARVAASQLLSAQRVNLHAEHRAQVMAPALGETRHRVGAAHCRSSDRGARHRHRVRGAIGGAEPRCASSAFQSVGTGGHTAGGVPDRCTRSRPPHRLRQSPPDWLVVLALAGIAMHLVMAPAVEAQEAPAAATVVVGPPTETLREAARAVEGALSETAGSLADPSIAQAFRGHPGRDGDGLEGARALRRSLGLSESADAATLVRMARFAAVPALLLVRAPTGHTELVVFDARRGAYFEGALSLPAEPAAIQQFAQARVAASRTLGSPPNPPLSGAAAQASLPPSTESDPLDLLAAPGPNADDSPDGEESPNFFEENWPFMVAGALLAGAVTWFVVSRNEDPPPAPVLRFVPGE